MIQRAAFLVVLCLAASVRAQDGEPAKAPPAEGDQSAAKSAGATLGVKAGVKLRNGRTLSGVVRVSGTWERKDEKTGWTSCGKDDAGACVRLWFVSGRSGWMVVPASDVESVEDRGALSDADLKKMESDAAATQMRSKEEGERRSKERDERFAAQAAAEAARVKEAAAAKQAAETAAAKKAAADLLAKFPRKEWGPERRDEIHRRSLILHILPNELEREFLKNYEAWSRAAAAAKAEEEKAAKDAAGSAKK